ncbi:MAG: Spy/CpxP family protein refolding chaperone [Gammaproteobacteria bacterium]|nr:Spy/CpxP family protein refolding chaperone [Gammaproteobacteria bacterium]
MKKSSKIIVATVLTVGVAGGVFAYGAHHHFHNMTPQDKAEMISDRIDRKLDLNDLQKQNLDSLTLYVADLVQQVREERQARFQLMDQLLSDNPVDQAALLQKINEKTAQVNENAPELVARLATFVDSLDAEQKAEIQQMIERRGRHGFGRHHGPQGYAE